MVSSSPAFSAAGALPAFVHPFAAPASRVTVTIDRIRISNRFPGVDSNHHSQVQSLLSCP